MKLFAVIVYEDERNYALGYDREPLSYWELSENDTYTTWFLFELDAPQGPPGTVRRRIYVEQPLWSQFGQAESYYTCLTANQFCSEDFICDGNAPTPVGFCVSCLYLSASMRLDWDRLYKDLELGPGWEKASRCEPC